MTVASKLWSLLPSALSKGAGRAMDAAKSCRQAGISEQV
jgi:hypothetical protein